MPDGVQFGPLKRILRSRIDADTVYCSWFSIHHYHLFESGDIAHTQALTHTHTIHNNTKEGK